MSRVKRERERERERKNQERKRGSFSVSTIALRVGWFSSRPSCFASNKQRKVKVVAAVNILPKDIFTFCAVKRVFRELGESNIFSGGEFFCPEVTYRRDIPL